MLVCQGKLKLTKVRGLIYCIIWLIIIANFQDQRDNIMMLSSFGFLKNANFSMNISMTFDGIPNIDFPKVRHRVFIVGYLCLDRASDFLVFYQINTIFVLESLLWW